ncbi:hypothetical protein [Sphingobium sp. CCH11-B1]|uniref:hypothetical protein n=1 Tax=Sphingobium sp. CCH11-B1 TaxID=1768781 RepID=UPI001E3AE8B1|nr:hypothetical protein [Sphingobium sp. CCH11-B1]
MNLQELLMSHEPNSTYVRRIAALAVALTLMTGSASAKVAAPERVWGKAGVTYEQYRADALECGKQALAADIDRTDPVKKLRQSSEEIGALDQQLGATSYSQDGMSNSMQTVVQRRQMAVQGARVDQQYKRIKQVMFETARACMTENGYSRFTLTSDQQKAFSGLKDVEAGRRYIYTLASDGQVLQAQKYTDQTSR